MNSINNKSVIQTLKSYLSNYNDVFYKRSFENFVLIVISMLYIQEIKSIKFLHEKFIKKYWNKCLNSFYYFLADKNFSLSKLAISTINIAMSLIPDKLKDSATIYLIIDDTLQEKYGDKFECCDKLFDHTRKNGSSYLKGHCFVSLVLAIPVAYNEVIHYIKIPIEYKLYDKSKTKLELAIDMITRSVSSLESYQVVVLCDSWYTKNPLLKALTKFKNVDVIGALRKDTVLFDLAPKPTGKRGRPRKKGDRLNYRNFKYEKEGNYFIATVKVITNLLEDAVYITATTTDIEKFSSVRLYMSTIDPNEIKTFDDVSNKNDSNSKPKNKTIFNVYRMRWNIEVVFYQIKSFWSFGNYMVRNKEAIEKYINLIGVTYTLTSLLPFMSNKFSKYKFQSPQEIKYHLSECISKELIYNNLLKTLQINKNIITLEDVIEYLNEDSLAS